MSSEAAKLPPKPVRSISDEFRELQFIVDQFQNQLNTADGTVGLHPFGPVNVEKAQTSFIGACSRLREALTGYRDTTLVSWRQLLASDVSQLQQQQQQTGVAMPESMAVSANTHRAVAAAQELSDMRNISDAVHEDARSCSRILFDAASDSVSRAISLSTVGQPSLLVERLQASAKKMGLAHYTDVQNHGEDGEITTVTLAGGILVIDVDIGSRKDQIKVKVSYVSDIEHDERIDALMLGRLVAGDIRGFEKLVEEMAELDRLTKERTPANFIHNTFALAATLAEIQKQELGALDGDVKQLLSRGSGVALPQVRHVGPSTLFFVPAVIRRGLEPEDWPALEKNDLSGIADIPGLRWLHYSWEPSSTPHCFLSTLFQKHCLQQDYMAEDSGLHTVVTVNHPNIHGLELRFLEFKPPQQQGDSNGMQVDGQSETKTSNSEFWIPYSIVARLESPMPACALTVKRIMTAVSSDAKVELLAQSSDSANEGATLDSPRLLEDAPTLENMVYCECAEKPIAATLVPTACKPAVKQIIAGRTVTVELDAPQIRAWALHRIPLSHPRNVLSIVPVLRRQAVFNELLASCFSSGKLDADADADASATSASKVHAKTYANDPFRIDIFVSDIANSDLAEDGKRAKVDGSPQSMDTSNLDNSGQGVVLRVIESTGDILAWTHQSLGISVTSDILTAMSSVPISSLTKAASHANLSAVANISNSIPMVAFWLSSNPQ
ncbi:hypothetical protein GGI15_004650 [Coemansia interrupta]|uniref:Mediator of RNA polymerase II transcription subunit 1 n=1 Tax=Coemansia interrupta TaxID=1126814 RepID=A0A9W8H665_9FUNG|nr:hypothetical protein GGI15_004650 [Coemansia interrupta]